MKLPNKIISYKESIISKFSLVLEILENHECSVVELYYLVKDNTEDVAEFLDSLDCLFAFGKIKYDKNKGSLTYVV